MTMSAALRNADYTGLVPEALMQMWITHLCRPNTGIHNTQSRSEH